MREKILFDDDWLFHKGDVPVQTPKVKGPVYTSAKTERKKQGPACIYYNDAVDDFRTNVEYNADKWVKVNLPHDYIISGEVKEDNNPALGFFDYDNGSKSSAPCLQSGHTKSGGRVSPSYTYPQILHTKPFFFSSLRFGFTLSW